MYSVVGWPLSLQCVHHDSPLFGILLLILDKSSIFLRRLLNALSQSLPFDHFFVGFFPSNPQVSSELLELLLEPRMDCLMRHASRSMWVALTRFWGPPWSSWIYRRRLDGVALALMPFSGKHAWPTSVFIYVCAWLFFYHMVVLLFFRLLGRMLPKDNQL